LVTVLDCLQRIADVISTEDLVSYRWPQEEHLAKIAQFIWKKSHLVKLLNKQYTALKNVFWCMITFICWFLMLLLFVT